jgi:hypothetical protein
MSTLPLSSAADRNKQPILEVLRQVLPPRARVLEIASGTGQHAAWFAAAMPGWTWQPTDAEPKSLRAIAAWCAGLANVQAPRNWTYWRPTGPWAVPSTPSTAPTCCTSRPGPPALP